MTTLEPRTGFVDRLSFEPDRFQVEAFDALDEAKHVIVAAPTGSGKTLVAEYAVSRSLALGQRVFYTSPIKALSNQKFRDLVAVHGPEQVGLLTGDNSINGEAPVVVMTTEVLRNMLYAGPSAFEMGQTVDDLGCVVLDEVHYLQDAYRGPVWEEVIIHLPRHVQLLCLSATVSNADELAEWIETVRGPTSLVTESQRPVELTNRYLVGERGGSHLHFMKALQGTRANPKGFRFDNQPRRGGRGDRSQRGRSKPKAKWRPPNRVETVQLLDHKGLLPAIFFIFSRAACDDAAKAVVGAGLNLTSGSEREQIDAILAEHVRVLDDADLEVLEYPRFRAQLLAGVASHHAGMVPPLKEAVEACFIAGLVRVVFATETLALGVNMPARTVVIEKLTKYNGEGHEFLTPAQYTQLTGRAGRRGIDTHGEAVVLWSPWVRFEQVAELAGSKRFTLTSSFRPTYNMAANLVRRYDPERARQLLNLSFAQFRADAGVVRIEQRVEKIAGRIHQLESQLEREFGPISELQAAARNAERDDSDAEEIAFALSRTSPGEVLKVVSDHYPSPVVVLSVAYRKGGRVKARAVDGNGDIHEVTPLDLWEPPEVMGVLELPEPYLPQSMTFAHEVSQLLARARLSKKKSKGVPSNSKARTIADLEPGARKGLSKLARLEKDLERAQRQTRLSSDSLGGRFDRVIELLQRREHLQGWMLTPTGERLARLYHESDLLVVEALDQGVFDELTMPELVGLASTFVYQERRREQSRPEVWFPSGELRGRFRRLQSLHRSLIEDELSLSLPETVEPDPGFVAMAYGWASGGDLTEVLADEEFTPGDFVRTAKQLIDILRQLAKLAEHPDTATKARAGAEAVYRDLVAASSMVELGDPD